MKLLLTSSGITNDSIRDALSDLVGKPLNECAAAFIPTAGFMEAGDKHWMVNEMRSLTDLVKTFDIVDLANMTRNEVRERLEPVDIIGVGGGLTFYLCYCAAQSGFSDLLPELLRTKVYMGISAGSQLVGDNLRTTGEAIRASENHVLTDDEYDELGPPGRSSSRTAQLVDFVVRPHFNSPQFPKIREPLMREHAQQSRVPIYLIDDQSAVKVRDDAVEVISEGKWMLLEGGKQ